MLVLSIPNNNVRKQYYGFLLEEYQKLRHVNLNDLELRFAYMALNGKWEEALRYMADAYAKVSSVRDGIEAERRSDEVRLQSKNLQGFFMAYLNLNAYYYTAPELEVNHGYCDFFLLPDLTHCATKHSRYAQAPRVEALRQGTRLHKIIMQFEGWEVKRMEEVE